MRPIQKAHLTNMNLWYVVVPVIGGSIILLAIFLVIIIPRIQARQYIQMATVNDLVAPANQVRIPVVSGSDLVEEPESKPANQASESRWPAPHVTPQTTYGCENPPCPGAATYHSGTYVQPFQTQPTQPTTQSKQIREQLGGPRFSCDYLTGTCIPDPQGNLTTCDECEKRTYFCDSNSWTCRDVGFLRDSASQCRRGCYPDLRIRGVYTPMRSDVNANGEGAFCAKGRFRKIGNDVVEGTNVPNFEWEDMSCVGYKCCQSQFCDEEGLGTDPYSVSMCATYTTESGCDSAINKEVPAYCEWTGSACQAALGESSVCAACTADTDCPGKFGAFKCVAGACVAQGNPKCDAIHKEYTSDEVVPEHIMAACKHLFNKDRETTRRVCANERDGNACAGTYLDRMCQDRYGKTWTTERTHCGARSAPKYPSLDDSD
jgi:hypothetical protein